MKKPCHGSNNHVVLCDKILYGRMQLTHKDQQYLNKMIKWEINYSVLASHNVNMSYNH